ncbi:MAG TPA: hypothetical protein VK465_15635, partial [Fibrobacteria bacterium]|nr:hypothetical protein [Fibrobacteria bacterium]
MAAPAIILALLLSLFAGAASLQVSPGASGTASTVPAGAAFSDRPGPLRILSAPSSISGWMRASTTDSAKAKILATRRRQLDWYASLGFTHVVYPVDIQAVGLFHRSLGGAWVYNGGHHDGEPDSSFRAMKAEVEAHGMRLIPQVNALSHADAIIQWVDSTVSEFPSRAAFFAFAASKGLPLNRGLDHVAAPVDNPAADRIFAEFLGIVKANWGNTPLGGLRPSHVLIGHDELGFDSVCFVKAGRSRTRPESPARHVAMEIAARVRQVDSVLGGDGGGPDILVHGDSFLPSDVGECYGLVGEPGTGRGGTLAHLAESPTLRDRLLVVPWNYLLAEGERHYWSRLPYRRSRQLALLDTLGFRYVLGIGEHGSNSSEDPGR